MKFVALILSVTGLAITAYAQGPTITVQPSTTSTIPGQTFTVDIAISNVTNLYSFQFDLVFTPGSVNPVSVGEGPFLPSGGSTVFVPGTAGAGTLRSTAGTLAGPLLSATGGGVLATVTFTANSSGPIAIGIANVILLDIALSPVAAAVNGGLISSGQLSPPLVASPPRLSFEYQIGQAAPVPQSIALDSDGPLTFSFDSTAPWLSVTSAALTSPTVLRAAVSVPGLQAGNYAASIRLHLAGLPDVLIPVSLRVYDPSQLITVQDSLSFNVVPGGEVPAPQTLYVTASSRAVSFSATTATSAGGNWLSVTSSGPNTPANVTVAVNALALAAGVYTGTITLSSPAASGLAKVIPVTLRVNAARPAVSAAGIVNGASFAGGPIAPGEIVTIFGSAMGGPQLQTAAPSSGRFATVLAQTRVLFDGIAAPVLYAQNGSTGVVVPYAVAGQTSSRVEVEYQGVKSDAVSVPIAAAVPGIFTSAGSGKGQAAALNEDGSINSAAHPAAPGSTVVLFATGAGLMLPADTDGRLAAEPLAKAQLPVVARIGDLEAEVRYEGAAPGLVSGVLQVNVRIPKEIAPSDTVPVSLVIGGVASQPGVTLAVY